MIFILKNRFIYILHIFIFIMTIIYDKTKNSMNDLMKILKAQNNTNYFFDIENIVIKLDGEKDEFELNDVKKIRLTEAGEYIFEF